MLRKPLKKKIDLENIPSVGALAYELNNYKKELIDTKDKVLTDSKEAISEVKNTLSEKIKEADDTLATVASSVEEIVSHVKTITKGEPGDTVDEEALEQRLLDKIPKLEEIVSQINTEEIAEKASGMIKPTPASLKIIKESVQLDKEELVPMLNQASNKKDLELTIANIKDWDKQWGNIKAEISRNKNYQQVSGGGFNNISKSGVSVSTGFSTLNFTGSGVNSVTQSGQTVTVDISGGSGGSPGGSDTQLQYNNAGSFGGITGATSNGTTVTLTSPTIATSQTNSYATASTIAIFNGSKQLISADTSTYPSLTELSYVKGVTSSIQTQLNTKGTGTITSVATGTGLTGGTITTTGTISLATNIAPIATLGTAGQLIRVNAGGTALEYFTASAGGVSSVVGTSNRITVDSTDPANPIVDIASTYVGQNSITTLGTIATGTWNATAIGASKGGTGLNTSASTGVAQVSAGTWSVSTALANGTTATTQSAGDNSTKVATTAYADAVVSGYVPTSRTLTINGSAQTLAADRTWTITTTGTTNRISVTGGTGLTPTVDIDAAYVGQTSITTLGTVSTGTWIATTIAVNKGGTGQTTYTDGQLLIGNSTGNTLTKATLTGTANNLSVTNGNGSITLAVPSSAQLSVAKLTNLTSNGFVKTSAGDGTLSIDTNTYLTGLTVGSTTIASGTTTRILYDNAGVLGEYSVIPVSLGGTNATSASITAFNNITGYSAAGTTGTTSTNLVFSTSPTITTPVINGTVTGTGVSQSSAASTLVQRDSNQNIFSNNTVPGFTTTATAAGTTTLTVASTYTQYFTGSTTQTVKLPDATTLSLGHSFSIINFSSGAVTVNDNSNGGLWVIPGGGYNVSFYCLANGTAAGTWNIVPITINAASGKHAAVNNNLTFSGTDGTTMTFPSTSATVARTDAAQTFTGIQTFAQILTTPATISVSSNAGTVTRSNRINNFTNSSAATMTITMSTTGATDGDMVMVVILDASAAAQTITWVNTENSTVTAPTTSNGSTTLPLTVGFKWNAGTSKWRCIAKA